MEWLGWALKSIFHLILTFYMYYDSISAVALTSVWYAINMFCKINEIKHQLNVFIFMIKHLLNSLRMLITQRMNHLRVLTSTWKSKFILDWNSSPQVSHFICQNKVSGQSCFVMPYQCTTHQQIASNYKKLAHK